MAKGRKTRNGSRVVQRAKKEQRRADHEARVEKWQSLKPEEQLAELDVRLGTMWGAIRQRTRILERMKK